MAISIDTVYQRVLALANKEQRGYITPQEFNLLANQAQLEIFEQYFYDENQTDKNLKNSTEFSNVDEILDEKISTFKAKVAVPVTAGQAPLPWDLYRLGMVYWTNKEIELEQLTEEEALYLNLSLSKPTRDFPAYVRVDNVWIRIYPPNINNVSVHYIKIPKNPKWGYVVVNELALYNAVTSQNFELHKSDETELVYKILSLAGIVIAKPGLGSYGDQQITGQKTQEKQ